MKKILVVEDEKIHREMYQKLLSNHGFEVEVAVNGEEGLRKALEIHPDLVILDIQMPIMDGMTVMSKLREDTWGKNVKIILLTNFDADDKKLDAVVKSQPAYYLVKASNKPEEVLEKVIDVINSHTEVDNS